MEKVNRLFEVFRIQVGINLGGGDAFVAEHILYGFEVGATFHEVGGKGMAKGVRADVLLNAHFFC